MVNFIGSIPALAELAALQYCHSHAYAKAFKPGRKVGHATLRCPDRTTLEECICEVEALLPR
jgi:5-(carboxyamino)imidazole ribonucleotide synthase